jgi:hypothetical protein
MERAACNFYSHGFSDREIITRHKRNNRCTCVTPRQRKRAILNAMRKLWTQTGIWVGYNTG